MAELHQHALEPGALRITHHPRPDGVVLIEAAGEVDLSTAPDLVDEVREALDRSETKLCVLDLTAVTFLASAGLAALTEAARHAGRLHEPLRIVVDSNRPVIRPIELTGLDRILALYHSVDEALAAGG
ncbi:STAS domain-containing protein [Amycolatopsis pigmentata]|uniref:Anti-sigma factor antagonist n=1 Tax=Amycolatopsis pigmentata TaxID=450801 RepID=A0ABW5FSJ4_9PSEU